MTNPLQIKDVDNELLRDADDYLRKHKILELFEVNLEHYCFIYKQDLTTILCYKQPENIEQFLVDMLKQRKD